MGKVASADMWWLCFLHLVEGTSLPRRVVSGSCSGGGAFIHMLSTTVEASLSPMLPNICSSPVPWGSLTNILHHSIFKTTTLL